MQTPLYKVLFSGDLEKGYPQELVKRQCAVLFKKPRAQIEPLFAGKPVTIKSGLTREQAENYVRALRHIGAKARIATSEMATDSPLTAPRPTSKSKPVAEIDRRLARFKGHVPPVAVPWTYRLGIVAVSLVMIVLPVFYIVLTSSVVYGTVYYALHNASLFHRSGSFYFAFISYIAPIAAGSLLTLFMLKPLLAVTGRRTTETVLLPSLQPRFFKFVYRVCDAVGAPRPAAIKINNEVNASAGFYRGLRSFFSRQLVLTVGLPLIAGLNTRQLAGVLAHEFGHFSQGAGMRTTHIIRRVNRWFTLAVYQRDSLDEWLEHAATSEHTAVQIALQATRLLVFATRRVLWALMLLGHALGAWMSRQMEFDADRYEARVAGSEYFKHTAIQLIRLNLAHAEVMRSLRVSWENHQRLVDDVSAAVVRILAQQPKNIAEKIEKDMELERSERFDTHPSDIERIENAAHENTPGIFQVELPAQSLLLKFSEVSCDSTLRYYRQQWRLDVGKSQLIPVDEFTTAVDDERRSLLALDVFFYSVFNAHVPIQNNGPIIQNTQQQEALAHEWRHQRDRMRDLSGEAKFAHRRIGECEQKLDNILLARAYLHAGFEIDPREFGLADTRAKTLQYAEYQVRSLMQQALMVLTPLVDAGLLRMRLALSLALPMDATSRVMADTWTSLFEAAARLSGVMSEAMVLHGEIQALGALLANHHASQSDSSFTRAIAQLTQACVRRMHTIQGQLRGVDYPFEHSQGQRTLNDYVLAEPLEVDSPSLVQHAGEILGERLFALQRRVVARLATHALAAETAMNLR